MKKRYIRLICLLIITMPVIVQAVELVDSSKPDGTSHPSTEPTKAITLDEALHIAFKNNPDLKSAISQVEGKKGALSEAKSRFFPSFTLGGTTTFQGPISKVDSATGSMAMQSSPDTSVRLSISLPLDISNQLRFSSDIARIQYEGQYLTLLSVCESLIVEVKQNYYSLLRMQAHEKVAQASVDDAKARLEVLRAKRAEGMVPQFDVTSVEVEVENLTQELLTSQSNVNLAQSTLNTSLGIDPNRPTEIVSANVDVSMNSVDIAKMDQLALSNRSDLNAALKSNEVANKSIKLRQTDLCPQLSLSGGPAYDFNPSGFGTNNYTWSASINLSVSIFDGGQNRAKVRQAKANAETVKASVDKLKLTIVREVREAAINVQNAALRTKTTDRAVKLAEDALSISKDRYEAGIAVLVEVSNAEKELAKARSYRVDALFDYAVAVAQLEKAVSSQPELKQLRLLVSTDAPKEKSKS